MPRIAEIILTDLDVGLSQPFGISGGAQRLAENILVRVRLDSGHVGLGEAAPFPAYDGETRAMARTALQLAVSELQGTAVDRPRKASEQVTALSGASASARCALETALLDAWLQSQGIGMWSFFGGATSELTSDITIVTGSVDSARRAARDARADGFRVLKIKVGGCPVRDDQERLAAICEVAPEARLVLDANAGLSSAAALELVTGLGDRLLLFEQPCKSAAELRRVREAGVRVAADESARTPADVFELARAGAVDVINVKPMKSGLWTAFDMAVAARAAGLGLMIGGLVETELAMTVSGCLAAGLGGFEVVDLDTPLFLEHSPMRGGLVRSGATLRIDPGAVGHGVTFAS